MFLSTLRGGVIGAGIWSTGQLRAWRRVEGAEIVALCDRDTDRLETAAANHSIDRTYTDAAEMRDAESLDFVDICTRPDSHAPLIELMAGRVPAILCQKPFCTNLDEARAAIDVCAQRGTRLMVNENFRWQAWYRKIKELLEAGAVGDPFFAHIHWRLRTTLPTFEHAQAYFREMPRLAVYELGVHYIDVFRFLFGEPTTVYAQLQRVSSDIVDEDVQHIMLSYGNRNLTCQINHSWASVPVPDQDCAAGQDRLAIAHPIEIDGTRGTVTLKADRTLSVFTDEDSQKWTFPDDSRSSSQTATLQHFVDMVLAGTEFATSGSDNLKSMAIVYACYESSARNSVITIPVS